MSNYEFDEVFSNIEITNELKNELFENCRKGRRTADFRMRHAGALTALLIIATVGCTGLGSYAMYDSVSSRMAAMSAEEKTGYVDELSLDQSVTITDSYSRELSDEEILRAAELEKKYNEQIVLPAESAKRVEKLSDWDGESVCFVEEDGKLHIPEGEMTDSQLLQFIDHNEKRDYVMEEEAKKNYIEEDSPYVDVDAATEKEIVDIAYGHLKFFLGEDIDDSWQTRVVAFKPSNCHPEDADYDMYTIYWEQPGSSVHSKSYLVVLDMHTLKFRAVAIQGREYEVTLENYTEEEALRLGEEKKPIIYKFLYDKYGFETPSKERFEIVDDYGDARQLRYVLQSGDTAYEIQWDISTDTLSALEIWREEWSDGTQPY